MTHADYFAFALLVVCWTSFNWMTSAERKYGYASLTRGMAIHRERWLRNSLTRDLKMIDTQIMAGLQNGTGFFASASLFALGGCFALLGATEQVEAIFQDLPIMLQGGRTGFELKVGGLAVIFAYSFFKFGWSYRLFNYCTILIGAIPMRSDAERDPAKAERAVKRAATMNQIAASHFNAGLRGIFFGLAYLGWFLGSFVLVLTTLLVIAILVHRQFFSAARYAVLVATDE